MKPIVAIVGRPNVGKSTFFNRIVGRRVSIVDDRPGVTRDRIAADAEWLGTEFLLIDTGGIEADTTDYLQSQMRAQAEVAMETADVVVFLVDGRDGVTASDRDVAHILRRKGKSVLLVVNKIDTATLPEDFYDFYELGLGEPHAISAANKLGLGDVLDALLALFPERSAQEDDDTAVHIAIIGKPNVGKSSIVNAMVGEQRVIVSREAGTTRDSIDTPLEVDGQRYVLIDTAGIRRKSRITDDIERYSVIRALSSIDRCDVAVLVIDAQDGITEQDKRIAGFAHDAGKGIIVAVNKWDLVEKETNTMRDTAQDIHRELPFMVYAPVLFVSALKEQRLDRILSTAQDIADMRRLRIPTGTLNRLLADAMLLNHPPSDKGRQLKIYYAAQIGIEPPLFSFQVNDRALMHFSYARYLENKIRESYGFEGTSIKFVFREKKDRTNG